MIYRRNFMRTAALFGACVLNYSFGQERTGTYPQMDDGPVIADTIVVDWPEGNLAHKGLGIHLGHDSVLVFDTSLLRFSAGAGGGSFNPRRADPKTRGVQRTLALEGRQIFGANRKAGWARDGSFDVPWEEGAGSLPRDWAHYKGFYRFGDRVLLEYSVGSVTVRESPEAVAFGGETPAFLRRFRVAPASSDLNALLLTLPEDAEVVWETESVLLMETGEGALAVGLVEGSERGVLGVSGGDVTLHLPAADDYRELSVGIFELTEAQNSMARAALARIGRELRTLDFDRMMSGGLVLWDEDEELVPEWFVAGRESYDMSCMACHQQGGGVADSMADSRWAGESPEVLARILLQGMEGRSGLMTSFDWMEDDELAAIISYIRVRWHDSDPVSADTIRRIREATEDRTDFWTEEELRALLEES